MFALHAPLATENSWGLDVRVPHRVHARVVSCEGEDGWPFSDMNEEGC